MSDYEGTGGRRKKERREMDEWWEDLHLSQKILVGIGFGILGLGLLALFGWIVMLLWNWLMPDIFGLKEITYWQGWGLLVLSCILFKNCGSGSSESKGRTDRKRKRALRKAMRETRTEEGDAGWPGTTAEEVPPKDRTDESRNDPADGETDKKPDQDGTR